MESWIHTMVRKACRRRVVAWGIVLAGAVAGIAGAQRYFYNFTSGPFPISPTDLAQITDVTAAPKYYVTVSGSEAIDTGLEQITVQKRGGRETSRAVSARYYALAMGDRFLLVKSSAGLLKTVQGSLEPVPLDVNARLFNSAEMLAVQQRFYPFYLNDESFRTPGYFAIVGAIVLGFLFLRSAIPAWKYLRDPSTHPVLTRVDAWGDQVGVSVLAEREFAAPHAKGGGWRVGDTFIIRASYFSFDILRMADLLWAYKSVTKRRVNFVPAGTTYQVVLACYGGTAQVQGSEHACDDLLVHVARRAPWAAFGYSDELLELFNKRNGEFCAAIEQRRQQLAAS